MRSISRFVIFVGVLVALGSMPAVASPASPMLVTAVSDASILLGETFTDTATVSGPVGGPTPTGVVNFYVYGPDNSTCSGQPAATSMHQSLTPTGTATSSTFTPAATGTYRVVAVYTGDANYMPVEGACGDPNETVMVESPPPPPPPSTSEQCKNGGWKTYGIFRNQGDCVSYIATRRSNPPAG